MSGVENKICFGEGYKLQPTSAPIGIPSNGTTEIVLNQNGSGMGEIFVTDTNFSNTTQIFFSGIYQIS